MPVCQHICPATPDDCCYVVLIQHISELISDDHRILTKSYERAQSYCLILKNAYENIHEPYVQVCHGCRTNQCQVTVKLIRFDDVWFYNNNMIYYQDMYYENGLCNADQDIEFNNQNIRQAIIRHGGECLVNTLNPIPIHFT